LLCDTGGAGGRSVLSDDVWFGLLQQKQRNIWRTTVPLFREHTPTRKLLSTVVGKQEQRMGSNRSSLLRRHQPSPHSPDGIANVSTQSHTRLIAVPRFMSRARAGRRDGNERQELGTPMLLHAVRKLLLLHITVWLPVVRALT
jgi:hypothetical protein